MTTKVYYNQEDTRWKNTMYSNHNDKTQTIGLAGCGPTSMAMVLSTFLGKTILPTETAAWSVKKGYRTDDSGTAWGYFGAIGKEYGVLVIQTSSFDNAKSALAAGSLVIASMKSGHFTSGGHYILLVGVNGDAIDVFDPNKDNKKYGTDGLINQGVKDDGKVTAKSSVIRNEAKQYWIIPAPKVEEVNTVSTLDIVIKGKKVAVGQLISGTTYVPARVVGEALGLKIGYVNGKVTVNDEPVDTKLIDDSGYCPIRSLVSESKLIITSVTTKAVNIGTL